MKAKLSARFLHYPQNAQAWAARACGLAHSTIEPVATCSLSLGVLAAANDHWGGANLLIAAGLLLHFSVWFERWWGAAARA